MFEVQYESYRAYEARLKQEFEQGYTQAICDVLAYLEQESASWEHIDNVHLAVNAIKARIELGRHRPKTT
jgi:hypothetical protein